MTPLELDALAYSAGIALATVALSLPTAALLASWIGRRARRGRWMLDALLLLPMSLSPAVVGWLVVGVLSPPGRGTAPGTSAAFAHGPLLAAGLVAAATCLVLPLMVRIMRPAFEAVDHQLVLTARTLGATRWRAWWSITAAHAAPMMAASAALGFAAAWGETGAAVVLATLLQDASGGTPTGGASSVPLTLLSALQTEGGGAMAVRLAGASVAVALAAVLLGEWTRQRWRRRTLPQGTRGLDA